MNKQTHLPEWTFTGSTGWYAVAAALTLSGLENKWIKITAAQQRALGVSFGKQSIGLFDGTLMVTRKVAFGTDNDTRFINPANARAPY